ncbi:MAG TPA: alanine--tRNA ligase, partial [Planctomycetaceae bacterium]|nr:alanine--tRNA ligase [Planctomycetaceae bacterium]
LSVSVYLDDDEAYQIWHEEIGLPESRIERLGEDENFWPANAPSQGPDGVCGPCSEIFYHTDSGEAVEIWNLVFTQYNRVGPPPDNLRPLPSKNIDTGMGLERTAAVLQGVDTNFHIDILKPIVLAAADVLGVEYDPTSEEGRRLRRIADHVRACTFAIHENVYPGPQREKYVVRRLLRRAVLDGHRIGRREPFLYQLVPVVAEMMANPYPELQETVERVSQVIRQEETSFFGTIDGGLSRLERLFHEMETKGTTVVDGRVAANLYMTYGLPPELVESMAAERNYTFDAEGFQEAMREHGEETGKGPMELFKTGPVEALKKVLHETEFLGYETTEAEAEVKGIIAQDKLCDELSELGHDQPVTVVLDRTPFYGEAGGQVGDQGVLEAPGMRFEIQDTQRDGGLILHIGHLKEGKLTTGMKVTARVNQARRAGIRRAHTATHLLHAALQKTLGKHAQQQGSKVDDDWLRFDFTNLRPVTEEELAAIEQDVRERIAEDAPVAAQTVPLAEARAAGAMMLFGEKYPDPVRMVTMGDFSRELCGGTHLERTGDVQAFEILSEEGVSAGTRRIVALTGEKARRHAAQQREILESLSEQLGVPPRQVPAAVDALIREMRDLKKHLAGGGPLPEPSQAASEESAASENVSDEEVRRLVKQTARTLNVAPDDVLARVTALRAEVERLRAEAARLREGGSLSVESLLEKAETVGDVKVITHELPAGNPALMRQWIDRLRKAASPIAVLLATGQGGKALLVAGVSRDLTDRVQAPDWVKAAAAKVQGGGGGKPDLAQAGGKLPDQIPAALEEGLRWIREKLEAS